MKVRVVLLVFYCVLIFKVSISVAGKEHDESAARYFNPEHIVKDSVNHELIYINTSFENASPLNWRISPEGDIVLNLVYDHQRSSPNRSISHWHFRGACCSSPALKWPLAAC